MPLAAPRAYEFTRNAPGNILPIARRARRVGAAVSRAA
jgi:hypothetical protein